MPQPTLVTPLSNIINEEALISKLDVSEEENKRFIAGYANIAGIRDSQGDVVTLDALRKAWAKWKTNPDFCMLSLLHTDIPLAKVVFDELHDSGGSTHLSGVDDKGLYLVAQVRDDVTISDEVWKDIERGRLRGFSIRGKNLNPQIPVCADGVCTRQITDIELYGVSIVDDPANKVSIFNMLKSNNLAKLADMTKGFKESIISEGFIKISKVPCPEGGHYHVLVDHEGLRRNILKMSREMHDAGMVFIEEKRDDEEYVELFDLARLRPYSVLTEGKGVGGFGLSPLSDEPKTEGETQMSEKEDVKKEEKESDDSETPETPEAKADEEEKAEEENTETPEAVAPITIESLAADLARLTENFENLTKEKPEVAEVAAEPSSPKLDVEAIALRVTELLGTVKTPPTVEEIVAEVEEVAQEVESEVAVEQPAETPAVEEEAAEPVLDLASLTRVSFEDIHEIGQREK